MEISMDGAGMSDMGMNGMMGWMLVAGLLGLAVLVAVVAGTVWAIRRWSAPRHQGAESAQDQLRRRFAAGEIDEEDYLSRRALLND
jgi:putative membrane protein